MRTNSSPAIIRHSWTTIFRAPTALIALVAANFAVFALEPAVKAKKAAPESATADAPSRIATPSSARPAQLPATPAANVADAKPLEESIKAGIDYLIKQQQDGGGWGQGGGWRTNVTKGQAGRVEGKEIEDPADLGNTCVGLMALLRTGHSPNAGAHQKEAAKAFEFICRQVEKSDQDSLYVTPVRDTQLQSKIGKYVDTFLAGWVLSELKGRVLEGEMETRRSAALDKVVAKIEKNQKENGSFEGNAGWASVLSQGLCSKALNSAARSGAKVSEKALALDQKQNEEGLNVSGGKFEAPAAAEPSSAGIALYRETSKLGGLWEKNKTNAKGRQKAEQVVADAAAPEPAKAQARADLQRIEKEDKAAQAATGAVASKLADASFVAGFGNNGGEEYLSYLTLAEALHAKGGKEWEDWKTKASLTVRAVQNADGGWSGHHCITGRTFCTGTALLVLTVGRDAGAGVAKAVDQPEAMPATDAKPAEVDAKPKSVSVEVK